MEMTRRGFLEMQAAIAASMQARVSANDRVRAAFIGCGARAHELMEAMMAHPQFEIAAVSDAYRGRIERAQDRIRARRGAAPRVLRDYREALADKSIDVVVAATPDHWHRQMVVEAIEAGKGRLPREAADLPFERGPGDHRRGEAHRAYRAGRLAGHVLDDAELRAGADPAGQAGQGDPHPGGLQPQHGLGGVDLSHTAGRGPDTGELGDVPGAGAEAAVQPGIASSAGVAGEDYPAASPPTCSCICARRSTT